MNGAVPVWSLKRKGLKDMKNQFSQDEKRGVFLRAVCSYAGAKNRWEARSKSPLNDDELEQALKHEIGIAGGSGCRDSISIAYQGSGLKIWASRTTPNHFSDEPIFQGTQTMKMARLVFNIVDPSNLQADLFGGA